LVPSSPLASKSTECDALNNEMVSLASLGSCICWR
jgi:hypothetical protein